MASTIAGKISRTPCFAQRVQLFDNAAMRGEVTMTFVGRQLSTAATINAGTQYAVQTPLRPVRAACKMCLCTVFELILLCPLHVAGLSACIEQVDRPLCSLIAQVPSSSSVQLGEVARPHLPSPTPSRAHVLTACVPLLAVTNLLHAWSKPGAPRQAERPAVACRPRNLRASAMRANGMRVRGM